MATVTYTFVRRCAGGGHTVFNVSLNGAAAKELVTTTDEIAAPLGQLTADEQQRFVEIVLRVHMAGKTRAQIAAEVASPVTVTI